MKILMLKNYAEGKTLLPHGSIKGYYTHASLFLYIKCIEMAQARLLALANKCSELLNVTVISISDFSMIVFKHKTPKMAITIIICESTKTPICPSSSSTASSYLVANISA